MKSGQRLSSWPSNHSPASVPTAMPGSMATRAGHRTWRKFSPPCSIDAGTSSRMASATTSGSGQIQASSGTVTRAEPKPVMPSTR